MQYIQVSDTTSGQHALTERLEHSLRQEKRVLWLVCGGLSIPVSVEVMKQLPTALTGHLTVLLTDERYGPVGHADSNAVQLASAGFDPKQASLLPILTTETNSSLDLAIARYQTIATHAFSEADLIIGQFGIGADGHIAGILPHSPATDTPDVATGYAAPPFVRLTLSFHALKRLAVAYVFVFGENKKPALEALQQQTLPFASQPAQILKELPEAYIYNDQIGDKS